MIQTLIACATCAADFKSDDNSAAWSIMFLLIVILAVLGTVVFCMVRMMRRSDAQLDPELMDDFPVSH